MSDPALRASVEASVEAAQKHCKRELAAVRKCYRLQYKKGNDNPAQSVACQEYMRAQAYCLGRQLCKPEYASLPRACTAGCPYEVPGCDTFARPMEACLQRTLGAGWAGPQPKT